MNSYWPSYQLPNSQGPRSLGVRDAYAPYFLVSIPIDSPSTCREDHRSGGRHSLSLIGFSASGLNSPTHLLPVLEQVACRLGLWRYDEPSTYKMIQ